MTTCWFCKKEKKRGKMVQFYEWNKEALLNKKPLTPSESRFECLHCTKQQKQPWHWCYRILKVDRGFAICEAYGSIRKPSWTGAIEPFGETKEDLIRTLEMMLNDAKKRRPVLK